MTVFGVDISNHQRHFSFRAAADEGIGFAFLKATEGSGFRDDRFAQHAANARANGVPVAAYHFLRSDVSVTSQLANVKAVVPLDVPVIPDVEWIRNENTKQIISAPTLAQTWEFYNGLVEAGYTVPILYLPQWYWDWWGRPGLVGLPPLWISWYPDHAVRRKEAGYALLPQKVWSGFGGLPVAVAQFTSSGAVADYPGGNIDLNAYRGTGAELAALLGHRTTPDTETTRSSDMGMVGLVKGTERKDIYAIFVEPDGLAKWHVPDPETAQVFKDLGVRQIDEVRQAWIDPIHDLVDTALGQLRVRLDAVAGDLADDEVAILTALRQIPTGGQVDIAAFVSALVPALAPRLPVGLTPDQVRTVLVDTLNDIRLVATPDDESK